VAHKVKPRNLREFEIDWFLPHRLWLENWDEVTVFSPASMIIHFDRGTIWQRDVGKSVSLRRR
jgi:hypothetical protein